MSRDHTRFDVAAMPDWFLPVCVCGGVPSVLFLVASLVMFVVWLVSGDPEPAAIEVPATELAKAEPTIAQPTPPTSPPPKAEPTVTPVESVTETTAPVEPSTEAVEDEAKPSQPGPKVEPKEEPKTASTAATDSGPPRVRFLTIPGPAHVRGAIGRASDYTYDHNTGRLGILGPWENAIGFISVDEQPRGGHVRDVQQVQLRGKPHALSYQDLANGGVFAIAQTEETGIILVNPESLEIVKSLRLDSWPTFVWTAGKSTPQHLYFTTQTSRGMSFLGAGRDDSGELLRGWEVKMQRIDLARMELDTRFQGEEFNTARLKVLGGHLVGNFLDVVSVDSDRRFTTYKDGIYSTENGRRLTKLGFQAQGFLPGGALVTGVNESEIVVGSINDGRIISGTSLPDIHERLLGRLQEKGRGHVFAKIFVDPKRKLLVVGRLQHVIIIPIETLSLPEEPVLLLDESPPTTAAVGEQYEFPLQAVSGEPDFTLVEGPEGMSVEDNVVRWRPDTAYTAPVEVKLKATAGDITREESWQINVE